MRLFCPLTPTLSPRSVGRGSYYTVCLYEMKQTMESIQGVALTAPSYLINLNMKAVL